MINENLTQIKIESQIKQIYDDLLRLGFPHFVEFKHYDNASEISKYTSEYFQPTQKRQQLIQWLILQINSQYESSHQKANKDRKMLDQLWKFGVLPLSKHTRNLDYSKYLSGLLGLENSVSLIYNLCQLCKDCCIYPKVKQDSNFGHFLQEIFNNYQELINQNYDPYRISFPEAFHQIPDAEFQERLKNTKIKIEQIKENGSNSSKEFQLIFKEYQENKEIFKQKYEQLVAKMKEMVKKYEKAIDFDIEKQQVKGGEVKISHHLSKAYREYKQIINIKGYQKENIEKWMADLSGLVGSLNDNIVI